MKINSELKDIDISFDKLDRFIKIYDGTRYLL